MTRIAKMTRIAGCVLLAVVVGGLTGCQSVGQPQEAGYVDPGAVIPGAAGQPTMYDLESSAQVLIQKMLAHPQFAKNYAAAKAIKGGRTPIVVVGNIANKTTERVQGRLDAIGDTIRAMLFDSSLFEIKNDEAANAIKRRIILSSDGGIENADELIQSFGEHDAPDFIVLGDLRHFADVGGYHTYRLHLAIYNLKTGKAAWFGVDSKVKL